MWKKVSLTLAVILTVVLLWYFFIKPYDYLVRFQANTNVGTLNQVVKTWVITQEGGKTLERDSTISYSHELKFNDSLHQYNWKFVRINDSLTDVKVYAKDSENSLSNKIQIPFTDTDFEKRTRKTLLDFNDKLREHLESFKVRVIGEEELQSTYCAYVSAGVSQVGKARAMMRDLPLLSNLLAENAVQLNGPPFIEITDWDQEKDSIYFDFCYPIVRSEKLPRHPELKYKRFYAKNAIKAEYNGNYITSDRAWYALLDYAKSNGYEVAGLPVEVYYNNPNMGGDAIQWRADIFLPVKSPNLE